MTTPKPYVPPSIKHKVRYDQRLSVYLSNEQQRRLAALTAADALANCASDCVRRLIDEAYTAHVSGQPDTTRGAVTVTPTSALTAVLRNPFASPARSSGE